jgi:hypothetical protein
MISVEDLGAMLLKGGEEEEGKEKKLRENRKRRKKLGRERKVGQARANQIDIRTEKKREVSKNKLKKEKIK